MDRAAGCIGAAIGLIVLSKAFGTILHEHHAVPWERIHIIPGGVNTARFQIDRSRQEARTVLGWPQDRADPVYAPPAGCSGMGLDRLLEAVGAASVSPP